MFATLHGFLRFYSVLRTICGQPEINLTVPCRRPPHHLTDCDTQGIAGPSDWRRVLCRLVRAHLLPAAHHRIEVEEISSSHNPIRATWVDGRADVAHRWGEVEAGVALTPEWVEVRYSAVWRCLLHGNPLSSLLLIRAVPAWATVWTASLHGRRSAHQAGYRPVARVRWSESSPGATRPVGGDEGSLRWTTSESSR